MDRQNSCHARSNLDKVDGPTNRVGHDRDRHGSWTVMTVTVVIVTVTLGLLVINNDIFHDQ